MSVNEPLHKKPRASTRVQVEYVWIDGFGQKLRSKAKSLDESPTSVTDLPEWKFGESEMILRPQTIFRDPFRGSDNVLVMCECYLNGTPCDALPRIGCAAADMDEPSLSLFAQRSDGVIPYTNPSTTGIPGSLLAYCNAIDIENSFGRQVMDAHHRCCLYAGIPMSGTKSGTNGEIRPGYWEYGLDPGKGISERHKVSMARYIIKRVCEMFNLRIAFDPKPVSGDLNSPQTMLWYRHDVDVFGPYLSVAWPLFRGRSDSRWEGRYGNRNRERAQGCQV
jgi:glutamine synthetase